MHVYDSVTFSSKWLADEVASVSNGSRVKAKVVVMVAIQIESTKKTNVLSLDP